MQVLTSSETEEWYTPPKYTDMARIALGHIYMDPASNEVANRWIGAHVIFTREDDGLAQDWQDTVFLNPPYGKTRGLSNQDIWATKFVREYASARIRAGVMLTKTVPGYAWWERLFRTFPVCMVEKRISFLQLDEAGEVVGEGVAKAGSSFWYAGDNIRVFEGVFHEVGRVIYKPSDWLAPSMWWGSKRVRKLLDEY
jgi:hypothetical protein